MAGNPITDVWSAGSYATTGVFQGEIISINDPLRRNRVQVRIFGYQDDRGTIPDDKLAWYGVSQQNSQLQGAGSSHNYYPGAKVMLTAMGTSFVVTGAMAGFDSDKRKNDKGGSGQSEQPDSPRSTQGEGKQSAQAKDGEGKDVTQQKRDPKVDKPLGEPDERKAYEDSREKAPFDKGKKHLFGDLKSIGIEAMKRGEDVLDKIKGMDGNVSGAIKPAIDIIKNLRKNGFGDSSQTIGDGNVMAAANQFQQDFGAGAAIDVLSILQELQICWRIVADLTASSAKGSAQAPVNLRVVRSLTPAAFRVSPTLIDELTEHQTTLEAWGSTQPPTQAWESFRTRFLDGAHQAAQAVAQYLDDLAEVAGGAGGLISMFTSPQAFDEVASILSALGVSLGLGDMRAAGDGAVGLARSGQSAQAAASGGGAAKNIIQQASALVNMFQGNQIALGEMKSGQIDPTSLLKIAIKYAKKRVNDPQKKFVD